MYNVQTCLSNCPNSKGLNRSLREKRFYDRENIGRGKAENVQDEVQDIENTSRVEKPQQCGGINFLERNIDTQKIRTRKNVRRARISRCTDFAIRASLVRGSSEPRVFHDEVFPLIIEPG